MRIPLPPATMLLLVGGLFGAGPVAAETLHCRVINGNATCAGSTGMSCQTINGATTCVSGDGSVTQRFSSRPPTIEAPPADVPQDAEPDAEMMPPPLAAPGLRDRHEQFRASRLARRQWIEREVERRLRERRDLAAEAY